MDKYIDDYIKFTSKYRVPINELQQVFKVNIINNNNINIDIREILKLSILPNQSIYAAINILILNVEPFYKDYLKRNIDNLQVYHLDNLHTMFNIKNKVNDIYIIKIINSQLYSTNVRTRVSHGKMGENSYNFDNYKKLLLLYLYIQERMNIYERNNNQIDKIKVKKIEKNKKETQQNQIYKDIFYLHLEECLSKQTLPNILLFSHLQTEKMLTDLLLEWINSLNDDKKVIVNKLITNSLTEYNGQFKFLLESINLFKKEQYIECLYIIIPLLETITINYIQKKLNFNLKNISLKKYIKELNDVDYDKYFNRDFIDFTYYLLNNNLIDIRHDLCHGRLDINTLNKTNCILSLCYIILMTSYFKTEKPVEVNNDEICLKDESLFDI